MTGDAKRFVSLGEMSVSSWPLFGFVPGAGTPNREWRRKRLKSLDSDSGMVGPRGRLTPNIWVPKNDAALRVSGYRQSARARRPCPEAARDHVADALEINHCG